MMFRLYLAGACYRGRPEALVLGDRRNLDLVWRYPTDPGPGRSVQPQVLQEGHQQTKEFTKGKLNISSNFIAQNVVT